MDTRTLTKETEKPRENQTYSTEIAEYICDQIRSGENLSSICRRKYKNKALPSRHTVFRWRKKYPDFEESFQEALNDYYWQLHDELDSLSKAPFSELYPTLPIRDAEAMARKRIQGLTFMLAKMAPRITSIFQDKKQVEHSGHVSQIVLQSYAEPSTEDDNAECIH